MLDGLFKLPIICFSVLYVQFSPDGHDIATGYKTTVELARYYYMGQIQFTTSVLNCVVIPYVLLEQMVEAAAFQK